MLNRLNIFCDKSVGKTLRGSLDGLRDPPRWRGPGASRPAALRVGDWGRDGGRERAGVPGTDTYKDVHKSLTGGK
jgi:hypothetical protein